MLTSAEFRFFVERLRAMLARITPRFSVACRHTLVGTVWMAVLLGALVWLDGRNEGVFLVPPFAATMTILLHAPDLAIAQPFAVVFGSTFGAAIGAGLTLLFGFGPAVAVLAALVALVVLPVLRAFHPPAVALAMCPALLHPGLWFAVRDVLPFTLAVVISAAALSRLLGASPRYPAPAAGGMVKRACTTPLK
jgi:CBS-domain-containing membrane protein